MHSLSKRQEWLVAMAVTAASGMVFLAGSAVSIALPAVQEFFDVSFAWVQWVVNAYVLALAALIAIAGSLGDRYGVRRVFLFGIFVFGVGSLLSGLSPDIRWLVAFQGLAGVGAALMIPGPLAVINTCIGESRRNRAIGIWAGVSAAIATLGPFVGGILVEQFGWPAVFYANVPLAAVAYVLVRAYVPSYTARGKTPLDVAGVVTLAVGLAAISYGLITGPNAGWMQFDVASSLVLGVVSLIAFIVAELKSGHPIVPFSLFRNPLVGGSNLVTLFLYFGLQGTIFFLVFNLQQVQGYSATDAGLALLPAVGLISVFSGPAGALADKLGPRPQMVYGPLVVALGFLLLSRVPLNASYMRDILPGLVLFGLGMAAVIAPLTRSALSVPAKFSGVASGVNNAISRTASMLAIAVLGAVMVTGFSANLSSRLQDLSLDPAVVESVESEAGKLAALDVPDSLPESERSKVRASVNEAFLDSFGSVMSVNAALALLSVVIAWTTIRPRRPREERT